MTKSKLQLRRAFWSWRNPFVKLLVLVAASALGVLAIASFELSMWLKLPIYIVWVATIGLALICVTAVAIEEKARRKRRSAAKEALGANNKT